MTYFIMSFSNLKLDLFIQAKVSVQQIAYVGMTTTATVDGKKYQLVRQNNGGGDGFDVYDIGDIPKKTKLETVNGLKIHFFSDYKNADEDGLYHPVGYKLL